MRQLLYIAHFFPPMGGAGVQRSVKFVKYLPEMGIKPIVLTGPGNCSGRWTPPDETLSHEIPDCVEVRRAKWPMEQDSAKFSPHVARLRRKALIEEGERVARRNSPGAILVSMSPFQDADVAAELSRRLEIPWIADLRDPWALDEFQVHRTFWHRMLERRKMQRALRTASLIVMNTPEAAVRFRQAFPTLGATRTISITNGYDSKDFAGPSEKLSKDRFTIVHAGFLHAEVGLRQRQRELEYRLLGRIEPGVELLSRSQYFLLKALEQWLSEEPRLKQFLRVILVGMPRAIDRELVEKSAAAGLIEFTGYQPHLESLRFVRGADLLFLPLHKVGPGRRATIVPGKTYEYMATGLPVLAAVPEGDAREFLKQAGVGLACEPDDPQGILRILKSQFRNWLAKETFVQWNSSYVEQFERRHLAQRLASEITRVCEAAGKPVSVPASEEVVDQIA